MKAVVARELGPPDTFRIEDVAAPRPGPGELRVAIHYAGVSFVDVLRAGGGYQVKPSPPFTPGSEFSGAVLEVGEGVADFAAGDRVIGSNSGGVFAEEIVCAAASAAHAPDGADMAEAAVLRTSYLTAVYALQHRAQVKPGETVLVLGAAGGVGIAAVQVAGLYGAVVIGSASTEEKRALILAQRAAHVVDSTAADWCDQIMALTDAGGVDVVVDPLGDTHTERAFHVLRRNGRHLVVGFAAGSIPRLPTDLALLKGASLVGVDLRQFAARDREAYRAASQEVLSLFASGAVRPPIARAYPLEAFAAAMQAAASGRAAGRIVLRMPAAERG
jgi:NADPH2:quinone reductase